MAYVTMAALEAVGGFLQRAFGTSTPTTAPIHASDPDHARASGHMSAAESAAYGNAEKGRMTESMATPESVGMSSARLARVADWMDAHVAENRLPGCSVAINRAGRVCYTYCVIPPPFFTLFTTLNPRSLESS